MENYQQNYIYFNNVIKSYGSEVVLNSLSFSIQKNDFVALIGNNGCGKTTTINIICNLIPYDDGIVEIFGSKLTPNFLSYKRDLGVVLSSPYLIEAFSIIEYLSFVGDFQFLQKEEIKNRSFDMIKLFELEEFETKKIGNLSSGNKMKVSLAAAMIHNPKVLILDEPFVNLDIKTQQILREILKSLKGKKTILITSHNIDLVVDLSDHFLIMERGKLLLQIPFNKNVPLEELKEKISCYLVTSDHSAGQIDWLK